MQKVLASARKAIAVAKPDDWSTLARAASWCIDNNVALDDARAWVAKSLAIRETMGNLTAKAKLLALDGNKAEAIATIVGKKKAAVGSKAERLALAGAE